MATNVIMIPRQESPWAALLPQVVAATITNNMQMKRAEALAEIEARREELKLKQQQEYAKSVKEEERSYQAKLKSKEPLQSREKRVVEAGGKLAKPIITPSGFISQPDIPGRMANVGNDRYLMPQPGKERQWNMASGNVENIPDTSTGNYKDYQVAVRQGYAGTFNDWLTNIKKAGASNINIGEKMPAEQVSQIGEYQAYIDTVGELKQMVNDKKLSTGPLEWIKKRLDNWGVLPDSDRIRLRSVTARLPGLMYAMRGKQLSDKELEVALNMMPQMNMDERAYAIALNEFDNYMNMVLKGKWAAFKGAGYNIGAFGGEPVGKKTMDEAADELIKKYGGK